MRKFKFCVSPLVKRQEEDAHTPTLSFTLIVFMTITNCAPYYTIVVCCPCAPKKKELFDYIFNPSAFVFSFWCNLWHVPVLVTYDTLTSTLAFNNSRQCIVKQLTVERCDMVDTLICLIKWEKWDNVGY